MILYQYFSFTLNKKIRRIAFAYIFYKKMHEFLLFLNKILKDVQLKLVYFQNTCVIYKNIFRPHPVDN